MNHTKLFACIILSAAVSFTAAAQKKTTHKSHSKAAATTTAPGTFKRDQRVYFPDFYTFYDPARSSFVYWEEDKWKMSSEQPSMLKDVDMGKARIQILKDDNKTLPEDNIEQYMKLYPAQPTTPTVTVPIITISKERR